MLTFLVLCGVFNTCLVSFSHGEFLGGTVSWMFPSSSSNDKVRLTYRLSWEKGTGPCGTGCNRSHIATLGSVQHTGLSSLSWKIRTGLILLNVSDVNYVVTSVSLRNISGWEQGENRFYVNLTMGNRVKTYLDDIPWVMSGDDKKPRLGYLETSVVSGVRNDTNRTNSSPYASVPSYIGIPFNCKSLIKIPVEDIDGDVVRCRLARMSECGGACTNIPPNSFWINTLNCSVTMMAFNNTGHAPNTTYRLTLVAEDYPSYEIQMGSKLYKINDNLSTVPIQLTIRVINDSCHTRNNLTFVRPTPANYGRTSYTAAMYAKHYPVKTSFYVQGFGGIQINDSDVIFSGPSYFNYSFQPDDAKVALNRTNVVQVQSIWSPRLREQTGPQQFCIWGIDKHGITTEPRCITSIIGDDNDYCSAGKVTCDNNGTCVNVYRVTSERCDCQPGYRSHNCSEVVQCNHNPCYNGGSCVSTRSGFYCRCRKGYRGTRCDDVEPGCDYHQCLNYGTCLNIQVNGSFVSYKCLCSSNFSGDSCQVNSSLVRHQTTSSTASSPLSTPAARFGGKTLVTSKIRTIGGGHSPYTTSPYPNTSMINFRTTIPAKLSMTRVNLKLTHKTSISTPTLSSNLGLLVSRLSVTYFSNKTSRTISGSGGTDSVINGHGTENVHAVNKVLIIHISVGLIVALVILLLVLLLIKRSCQKSDVKPQDKERSQEEVEQNSVNNSTTSIVSTLHYGEPSEW